MPNPIDVESSAGPTNGKTPQENKGEQSGKFHVDLFGVCVRFLSNDFSII